MSRLRKAQRFLMVAGLLSFALTSGLAAADDVPPPPEQRKQPKSKCGCDVLGATTSHETAAIALVAAVALVAARRRDGRRREGH